MALKGHVQTLFSCRCFYDFSLTYRSVLAAVAGKPYLGQLFTFLNQGTSPQTIIPMSVSNGTQTQITDSQSGSPTQVTGTTTHLLSLLNQERSVAGLQNVTPTRVSSSPTGRTANLCSLPIQGRSVRSTVRYRVAGPQSGTPTRVSSSPTGRTASLLSLLNQGGSKIPIRVAGPRSETPTRVSSSPTGCTANLCSLTNQGKSIQVPCACSWSTEWDPNPSKQFTNWSYCQLVFSPKPRRK